MVFRPRFSVRAMLVLVSLVAVYFGAWESTKRLALPPAPTIDWERHRSGSPSNPTSSPSAVFSFNASPGPFVVSRERIEPADLVMGASKVRCIREYHGWFFGLTAKLPFERMIELPLIDVFEFEDTQDMPLDTF